MIAPILSNRSAAALAVSLAILLTASPLLAGVVTVGEDPLALRAGRDLYLGSGSSITGGVAAGRNVSFDSGVSAGDVFAGRDVWMGRQARIDGRVLAGRAAEADRDLNFQGPSWTGRNVYFGRNAQVQGDVFARDGGVCIDRNASIDGSVRGNGYVWIDRDSTVTGDATPGVGHDIDLGRNVVIGGSTDPAYAPADELALSDLPETPEFGPAGGDHLWFGRNEVVDLDPGQYRSTGLDRNATLNLGPGSYDLASLYLGRDGVVNVDATEGDVILNTGSLSTDRNVEFRVLGGHDFIVNVHDGSAWLGNGSKLSGQVSVFDGGFGAGNEVEFVGSLLASKDIGFGQNAVVVLSGGSGGGRAVPEPGTVVLLAAGGALLVFRRHRRRTA